MQCEVAIDILKAPKEYPKNYMANEIVPKNQN